MTGTERVVRTSTGRAASVSAPASASAPAGRPVPASASAPASAAAAFSGSAPATVSAGSAVGAGLSLTERRKAATRMEIARAAAGLFMRNGLRATRAEDIARAAGVAPRTFYRYFASKEESLGPLFDAGAQKWAEAVRDAPAQLPVPEALHHAVVSTLTPGIGVRLESLDWVRSLLRLAEGNPALLRVWGEACQTAERTLVGVLAGRVSVGAGGGGGGGAGGVGGAGGAGGAGGGGGAGGAGSAGGAGGAESASGAEGAGSAESAGGVGGAGGADGHGSVGGSEGAGSASGAGGAGSAGGALRAGGAGELAGGRPVVEASPELCLGAAVAGAAVRVAVEAWAAGDDAADGPNGPVALAVRNLAALRGFPWSAA